jgi:hypothetical protein
MNKLLTLIRAQLQILVIAFIVPYHNTVENMISRGKVTVDCVTCILNQCEKKLLPQSYIRTPSFGKRSIH